MSAGSLPQAPLQMGLERKNALAGTISVTTAIFGFEHWSELPQKGSNGCTKLHCTQNEAGLFHICPSLGVHSPASDLELSNAS